jgi:LPS O-antigen subunit length determinant protein (WzzB/FepE family)
MDVIEEKRKKDINKDEIEIRLNDIIQFIKDSRRKMLIGGIIGLIIGASYVFSKPNIFKVEVTVMPEIQNKNTGGLGAVSAFTGLGFDNANAPDAIRPDLYPNVLQSVPFALNMLGQPVYSKKLKTKITLQEFINKTSTVSFLDKIFGLFAISDGEDKEEEPNKMNNSQAIQLTKEQDGLVKAVQGSVVSAYDKKTGILTITAIEPDPIVAATVAQLSLNYLTNYITAYRTDKARKRVIFLTRQVGDAKQRYQTAEYALSNYRDRNRSLFLNTAKLDEQRLQADYLLEQSVYSDLAKQLEQAKIKVEEDTPTFKILEPPTVPLRKSGPKRTLTTLGFAIVGIMIAFGIALIRRIMLRSQYT